jgi:DNA primase
MFFPDSFIDELKQRLPVSKVVGAKVRLKRYGTALKGICPFHKEKTPSFTVQDNRGTYHCFGCQAGGDVIEFICETEKLNFNEAITHLANLAGMELPKLSPAQQTVEKRRLGLIEIIAEATVWFSKQLKLSSNNHAHKYFINRGINDQDIEMFSLGYAPARGLLAYLVRSGFSNDLAVEAGLAIKTESKQYVERFRSRIIFPIKNQKKQIVGFGGRALDPEIMPKYLNSPETPVFKKNNILYLADIVRKTASVKERVVVVEGYMDAIFMHKAGVTETVAALGTAFNELHLQNLWNLADEVILCFDGDEAGKKAMLKAGQIALPILDPGLILRFCFLPSGKDPDEIIHQYGDSYMDKLLDLSMGLADFIWQEEIKQCKNNTPEGRAFFEHKIYEQVKLIKNPIVANHYNQFVKNKLWQEFNQFNKNKKKNNIINIKNNSLDLMHNISSKQRLEYSLFARLIVNSDLIKDVKIFEELLHLELDNSSLEELRSIIVKCHEMKEFEQKHLNDLLMENNLGKLFEFLCGKKSCFIDQFSVLSSETAKDIWIITHKKYILEILKDEYYQIMHRAHSENKIYERAIELKKTIDKLNQEILEKENNI